MIGAFTVVWTQDSVAFALLAGILLGYLLVGRLALDPAYASGVASAFEYGRITAVMGVLFGLVFYAGQIASAFVAADHPDRVLSRFGLWLLYAAACGLGTYLRIRRHVNAKHRAAVTRAREELGR